MPVAEGAAESPSQELPASGRRADGTFAPGNTAALRHGGYSALVHAGVLPEQAEALAAMQERQTAIIANLGGDPSELARSQVSTYARLELVADFLWARLQEAGPLTAKGRQRAALTAWLSIVDRQYRIAQGLGLERRQRPVDPHVAVQQAIAQVNQP